MSERMAHAMHLAEKVWRKAVAEEPNFVRRYLEVSEKLLCEKQFVRGDEFKKACVLAKVTLPRTLHPNTWVSGPRCLQKSEWMRKYSDVTPEEAHNHMPSVSLWKSLLFAGEPPAQMEMDI
tara:strand:+ start:248 stop:610 length:363 start_codon:yes stop_codon:yes gene_type:complete